MSASDPHIISRAAWGANPLVTPAGTIPTPSEELWLHHSGGEQFDAAGMRMLQAFTLHRPDEHYVDLEYTFVHDHVNLHIYESRGIGRNSAATGGHNSVSHAVCVMGNFQDQIINGQVVKGDVPSAELIHSLANLVAWGHEQGAWPLGFTGGHRDASGNSTACPGNNLEVEIPTINALAQQIHTGAMPGPNPPPKPPPNLALMEAPMLIPSPKQTTPNRFDGVKVDIARQTIANRGAGVCAPNPVDAIGNKPWDGAYLVDGGIQPDGFRHFVVVTTDSDTYEFHVK